MPNNATAQQWLSQIQSKKLSGNQPEALLNQSVDKVLSQQKARHNVDIIVTTGEISDRYEILGPVYFQVSNKGIFTNPLRELIKKYSDEIKAMRQSKLISQPRIDWLGLWVEGSVGQNQFEMAFFVAVRELQSRAFNMGGDAIVAMRQDIDLDTNGFQHFYLQMYGTVVRFLTA